MLPDDTKARRADLHKKLLQTQLNKHFNTATPEDHPEPYSDALLKEAAIQWLIETIRYVTHKFCIFQYLISFKCLADSSFRAPDFQEHNIYCSSSYARSEDLKPQANTGRGHRIIQEANESIEVAVKCELTCVPFRY